MNELIEALRKCGNEPYDITKPCKVSPWKLMRDAANVIETLANPQVNIVPVARQYDDSAIYVKAVLFYSDGTVVTSEVAKVSTMPAQTPKWISVEERLPEEGTRCIVTRFDDVTHASFIDILWFDGIWWNRMYKDCGDFNVTHWMPLPKAPDLT